MSELRWHPLLGEWVMTATERQERTFLPPADYCPLCPTRSPDIPTEIPVAAFDIAVFENRFPSLHVPPPVPAVTGTELFAVRPAIGACEVVAYTDDHAATLATLPLDRIAGLVDVWTDRYRELGARPEIAYVYAFENKGEVVGVTLSHPHGQIYAYPFVPPLIVRELAACEAHRARTGRCLLCDVVAEERRERCRIVGESASFVAFIPFFARYPYEIHLVPKPHVRDLAEFDAALRFDLARVLKATLVAYDALFDASFPYIMALHQRPTDGEAHEAYHFHIEFYPPMRSASRIKYLAGSEAGAGAFINDTLAEEKAAEVRVHWRLP